MIADPHEIQRLRYAPGQDLLSRDFRDQEAFEAELRWWHNRALHGAFGVSYGLGVTNGGASLTVERGLAYDAFGRELILPVSRTLSTPADPGGPVFLVIRYREEESSPAPGELAGVCPGGLPPRGADLAWVPADRFRPTDGVPLARVPDSDDDDQKFHPPVARALARPRIGHGSTVQAATPWTAWDLGRQLFGLKTEIDTRAAGFTQLPCYFAWVQGRIEVRNAPKEPPYILPVFPHIVKASPAGLTLGVLTFSLGESQSISTNRKQILASAQAELSVCWLGIQMQNEPESSPEVIHGNS